MSLLCQRPLSAGNQRDFLVQGGETTVERFLSWRTGNRPESRGIHIATPLVAPVASQ